MTTEVESMSKPQMAARDDNRKLALLVAINRIPKPKESDIIAATGLPKRCIYAMIDALGKMNVVIERANGRRYGYFKIADGGVYDLARAPEVLKQNYPNIFTQIEDLAVKKESGAAELEGASNVTPISCSFNPSIQGAEGLLRAK